ncbi:MAG: hypothetical protein E7630_04190 [Ruminococcaceae bacterium]|nr:hypothetical protein [Oscillospiraceae bacterium]
MTEEKRTGIAFLENYARYTDKLHYIDEQMFHLDRMILTAKADFGEQDMRHVNLLKARREQHYRRAWVAGARDVILQTVKRLPSPERQILERYYIDGDGHRAAEDLMEKLGFEKTHIYRLRDRALIHVGQIVMGEKTDVTYTVLQES